MRADSAFYAKTVIAACRRRHVRFSITTRIDAKIRAACESIPDTDWVDIRYPLAIYDEDTGRWIFDAQIAETCYTAFEGTRHRVTARLVVRRIRCNASSHCRSPPEIHSSARTSDERHPPRGERRPPRRHSALARVSWLAETTLVSVLVRGGVEGGLVYDLSPWSQLM